MKKRLMGMSMSNPVDLDEDYLVSTAKYAIEKGYTHFEIIGPTHHPIKGNADGMIFYRKYSQFNSTKDKDYVEHCLALVNKVCSMLVPYGIKVYYWHHELEIPYEFDLCYPEIINEFGDVEITHPKIKDFLENKIEDFFVAYPLMSGIVLTLHETRIPLLKLKNQKLDKVERVKYVTSIIYDTCKRLGKELIVRPFASLPEDYSDMMNAYESISDQLKVCDKWTQFDWSLTLPDNAFYSRIRNNPLIVETDIFGEYFGKGFLPIMLKDHITRKYAYCEGFSPVGYVSRIDRNGFTPFGTPNQVNLSIMEAVIEGRDVDAAIDSFFNGMYGELGGEVRSLMEGTEQAQIMYFYVNGFDFTELSAFPTLNSLKNCYKIEMMRDDYCISSDEWFIPKNFTRPPLSKIKETKKNAILFAKSKLSELEKLKGRMDEKLYGPLYVRFRNMYYVSILWERLIESLIAYSRYFETMDSSYESNFYSVLSELESINAKGKEELGCDQYYPTALGVKGSLSEAVSKDLVDRVSCYVADVKKSFAYAKKMKSELDKEGLLDWCLVGSGIEGHNLKKEVNFSDTYLFDDGECRIPGTYRGKTFSTVKNHGWFSYELNVRKNVLNRIIVDAGSRSERLDLLITVGKEQTVISEPSGERKQIVINYVASSDESSVRIRFDRISEHTPFIYLIKVQSD